MLKKEQFISKQHKTANIVTIANTRIQGNNYKPKVHVKPVNGAKAEAAYATPVPRVPRKPVNAEENLRQWSTRLCIPIDAVKQAAQQLRSSTKDK